MADGSFPRYHTEMVKMRRCISTRTTITSKVEAPPKVTEDAMDARRKGRYTFYTVNGRK